jgi:hypothetical protein
MRELYVLDSARRMWVELTKEVETSTLPAPRGGHGFASSNGKLYVYSGQSSLGMSGSAGHRVT